MTIQGSLNPEYKYGNLILTDNARQTIKNNKFYDSRRFFKTDFHAMNLDNPDQARVTETTTSMVKEGFLNPDFYGMNLIIQIMLDKL